MEGYFLYLAVMTFLFHFILQFQRLTMVTATKNLTVTAVIDVTYRQEQF